MSSYHTGIPPILSFNTAIKLSKNKQRSICRYIRSICPPVTLNLSSCNNQSVVI